MLRVADVPRFTDDDLWEEHGELAQKEDPYPEKQGEGPLFESQFRQDVLSWVRRQDWHPLNRKQFDKE